MLALDEEVFAHFRHFFVFNTKPLNRERRAQYFFVCPVGCSEHSIDVCAVSLSLG